MPDLWGGFPDYYGTLRVAPDASDSELRSAWRVAAKRWHPDTNDGQDAATMMRRVNEAWQVLGDRDARAVYDEVYFAWRTGSEQLAGELSGRLSMQQERRQARATSQEWIRWGREDRGRWGREQRRDAGAREDSRERGYRQSDSGDGARQESQAASASGGGSDRDAKQEELRRYDRWFAGVGVTIGVVVAIIVLIALIIENQ